MSTNTQRYQTEQENRKRGLHYAVILILFSMVCLLTAFIFNLNNGASKQFQVTGRSGQMQSLDVPKDKTVYLFKIAQSTSHLNWNSGWSAVTTNVYNSDKEQIFSFGDEFWRAKGYDDGHWVEEKDHYTMKVTFQKKGRHYLDIFAESNHPQTPTITVEASPKRASSIPMTMLGVLSLIIGIMVGYIRSVKK